MQSPDLGPVSTDNTRSLLASTEARIFEGSVFNCHLHVSLSPGPDFGEIT